MMWSRGSIGQFQSFAGAARRRQRLELEQLEDRCVLSGAGVLLPSQTAIPLGSMALQALRYQLALPAGMPLFAAAGQSPQMDYLYSSGHSATFDLTYQTNVPVTSGGLDATMMTDGKALQIELWAKPVSPADSKPSRGGGGQGTGSWSFPGVQDLATLSGRFHLYGGIKEGGFPTAITAGPDGDLWFLMELDNQVMRFSPETGLFTVFTIPSYSPQGITAGPDGNLWFTESLANKIGRLTPDGTLTEFALNTESSPDGITAGKDGNLWFTEMPGKIGRLTPADGTITDFALPAGIAAGKITAGPDGNLWFTIGTSYPRATRLAVFRQREISKNSATPPSAAPLESRPGLTATSGLRRPTRPPSRI
jgi:streptogramin lyase